MVKAIAGNSSHAASTDHSAPSSEPSKASTSQRSTASRSNQARDQLTGRIPFLKELGMRSGGENAVHKAMKNLSKIGYSSGRESGAKPAADPAKSVFKQGFVKGTNEFTEKEFNKFLGHSPDEFFTNAFKRDGAYEAPGGVYDHALNHALKHPKPPTAEGVDPAGVQTIKDEYQPKSGSGKFLGTTEASVDKAHAHLQAERDKLNG